MKISYQKFLISKFITQKCIKQCYYCSYCTTTVCMYCMWCDCFITNTLYAYKQYPTCDPTHPSSLQLCSREVVHISPPSLQFCSADLLQEQASPIPAPGEVVHISPPSISTALLCRPAPGTSKPHPSTRRGSTHQPSLPTALLCRSAPGTSKPHPSTKRGSTHQCSSYSS